MKRNKKLLVSFLALNAILSAYIPAATDSVSPRYERMYNSIVKNMEQGKSNDINYQTIERILKQRNKELKDLYLQGDYIVKPEYLEWQVFFTGYYEEYNEGVDNSKENARYHSQVSGYYDTNGNYISTGGLTGGLAGKPYQPLQQVKDINLGVSIPLKGMTRDALNLSLTPANEVAVSPNTLTVATPSGISIPQISVIEFQPVAPIVPTIIVTTPLPIALSFPGSGNGDGQWISSSGSVAPLHQQNFNAGLSNSTSTIGTTTGGSAVGAWQSYDGRRGTLEVVNNSTNVRNFNFSSRDIYMEGVSLNQSITYNGYQNFDMINQISTHAVMKLVGEQDVYINNTDINYWGNDLSTYAYLMLFHTDAHNEPTYTRDSRWHIGIDTDIVLGGSGIILYGVQSHNSGTTGSGMINNGNIATTNDTSYITQYIDGSASTTGTGMGGVSYSVTTPGKRVIFTTIDADSGNMARYNRYFYFENATTGKITLNGTQDVLANYVTPGTSTGGTLFTNDGTITLNGAENYGFLLSNSVSNYGNSQIILNNPLYINGDNSVGIYAINSTFDFTKSVIKLIIGNTPNDVNSTGNTGTNDSNYVDKSTGIFVDQSGFSTFDDYDIQLGQYSKNGVGLYVENGTVNLNNSLKNNSIVSDGGIGNVLLAAANGTTLIIGTNTVLEAKNGNNQTGIYADTATINNSSDLTVTGDASIAYILSGANAIDSGAITVIGGVYNDGTKNIGSVGVAALSGSTFSSTGTVNVDVLGRESSGLFAQNSSISISGGNIKASNNAFNLFSDNSTITLNNVTTETGQGSLLFYDANSGTFSLTNVTATVRGGTDSSNRGTAFYYRGSGLSPLSISDLTTYFINTFSGTAGNLTLNMDADSRLFIVDDVTLSLSTAATPLGSIPGGPIVIGTNYKTYMMYKSLLNIDQTVNLDNASDAYNMLEVANSRISNNAQSIIGTSTGQAAIAQENGLDTSGTPLSISTVTLTNNMGNIALSGSNSVGMYASYGEIYNINSGAINMTGNGSIGVYGANGSVIDNQANIYISNSGVGIYAEGYKQGVAQSFGDGKINITNSGLIQAGTSTNAIGIYANNNSTGIVSDSTVNLSTGSVDVSASDNGIGVLVNTGTVTDAGSTITVGKNGVAFYAKDSNVTLSGTTINLYGDNSLGLYLDGNTNFNGTGTINISGQNVVLFNMVSSGTVSNNFTVGSVAAGSTYTLGNIAGGTFEYTGSSSLASNGTLVSGTTSTIYLNGSTITTAAGATNVAAVALDGQGSGVSFSTMTVGTDGENNGTIVLGDTSVGIYGKNGARISNKSLITVGNGSAGLMTSGAGSFVLNSGTINIGAGSQGIYLKDGSSVNNTSTGNILSSGAGSVGIMVNSNTGTVMPVTNDGIIDLSGDKSIGIYSTGTDAFNITNNAGALIQIGNSSNASDPGIGIYSAVAGSTVTNSGTVTSGINSIGIYNSGGTVNNNGISNIGDAGVGIYSTGGIVNLNAGSALNLGTNGAVGVYGVYSTVTNSTNLNAGNSNYGFILKGGSFTNGPGTNNSVGTDSVYMYSTEGTAVTNDGNLTMTGSDNVGFYMAQDPVSGIGGASFINNGTIVGTAGSNNIGIYNYGGTVDNYGTVSVGFSTIVFEPGTTDVDVLNSIYSVGIYGENSNITNHSGATVSAGYGGYGIVAKGGTAVNNGIIITNGDYSTGMYTEGGIITNNGTITVAGDNAIGMAGKGTGSQIINNGTISITGNDAIGMYGNIGTIITNTGTINITGSGQLMVSSDPADSSHNVGSGNAYLNGSLNNIVQALGSVHTLPTLINAGIIKTNGVLALDGIQILIKPDPSTVQASSDPNYDFELSGTSIIADQITTSTPIVILPGFSDGTIANVYKLENVIQASAGTYDFISGSLLWEATPQATGTGADIYMSRKAFTDFTDGLWFEDFGTALENNYLTAEGDGVTIYNKTAYITDEPQFRHIMASMAGNVYANINQRENDIAGAFENSLLTLQESTNNTKENVKISVIAGKGKNKEVTDGVVGYDYTTTGALALREVERTYKHTFGYSLGYLHTGFEFNDGNSSEEWVDTIQLGVHNKYRINDWELRNNLTGRVSFHNVDRNIEWGDTLGRSEMNGTYETYSITSDNIIGKEFKLGKKAGIMPYGAFRAMYVTRPTFSENGLERLEVEGNDAWSVKPRAGVELRGALPLGSKTAWQLKGTLDLAYEYELADLNEREKAKLIAIEDGYHKLSKPEDEKGTFRTKAAIGVEVADRYGIFITGEYSTGNDKEDDYRAGVSLKAIF